MIQEKDSLFINRLAQGINPIHEGKEWFERISEEKQLKVLNELALYAQQAGVRDSDALVAITKFGLKATHTPCVLASKNNLRIQLAKILNLPRTEYLKSFLLLLALFSIADERRRNTQCKDGCAHWWHKNLI